MLIRPFTETDTDAVVQLWEDCGLTRRLGYDEDPIVSMSKRLIPDD